MRRNKERNSFSNRISIYIKIFQRTFGLTIEIFVVKKNKNNKNINPEASGHYIKHKVTQRKIIIIK